MSSGCNGRLGRVVWAAAVAIAALSIAAGGHAATGNQPLRVCADPNNLPFSNARLEGFENRIAAIVGRELRRTVAYYWMPQRRGFVRTTLNAGHCDLIVGVPQNYDPVLTTRPYYRSTFVFVSRPKPGPAVRSFDDPRLRRMRVGIQITGEDFENPPPAQALANRHLADRVRGFTVYGDYGKPDPQRAIIDAVAARQIDTAAVWGPVGGYFARREVPPLVVAAVPERDRTGLPFAFAIAMGVRRGDTALQQQLDLILERRRREIEAVLREFDVPLLPPTAGAQRQEGAL